MKTTYTDGAPIVVHSGETLENQKIVVSGEAHGVTLYNPSGVRLRNLTIDMSRVPRSYRSHGVRIEGDVRDTFIENVTVIGAPWYGFGVQQVELLRARPLTFMGCVAAHCVADGWDFKVVEQPNHAHFAVLERCVAATARVGFDIRGHVMLYDCVAHARTPLRYKAVGNGVNGLGGSGVVTGFEYTGRRRRGPKFERGTRDHVIVSSWRRLGE